MRHRYEAIAVLNGAFIMVLELVGARMISPYFGSSIYVWTAVVGVILGALSLGYWYGGELADRVSKDRYLGLILLLAAATLLLAVIGRNFVLREAAGFDVDIRLRVFAAALVLFAPANVLMGMASPYLVKLKVSNLSNAGSTVGGLYAAGTFGSILGTFATGYWLISWLGNRELGLWLVLGLVGASVLAEARAYWWWRVLVAVAAGVALVLPWTEPTAAASAILRYDADSAYSRLQVLDVTGPRPERVLVTDNSSAQSGIYLNDPDDPPFAYIKQFVDAAQAAAPRRILLVGGGVYTLPRLILNRFPQAEVDVVEIDPKLDGIARQFFGFRPDPRVRIIHEDGRMFLNANTKAYDLVYMDAFTSVTPPFQLTTSEAVGRLQHSLAPNGAVVVNLVSAWSGSRARFGQAEYATYQARFPLVRMQVVNKKVSPQLPQNLILIAGQTGSRAVPIIRKLGMTQAAQPHSGQVLTDDFAPVEQWTAQ